MSSTLRRMLRKAPLLVYRTLLDALNITAYLATAARDTSTNKIFLTSFFKKFATHIMVGLVFTYLPLGASGVTDPNKRTQYPK